MLRGLLIDDNGIRIGKTKETLSAIGITPESVDVCSDAMAGRRLLRTTRYDFLILDVCLPKREGDRPEKEVGMTLLEDVFSKSKYIVPSEVIGITEFDAVFKDAIEALSRYQITVINYKSNSIGWQKQIQNRIRQKLYASEAYYDRNKVAIITVHGIRTYGFWQTLVEETIREQGIPADVINFKYNYLPLLSYFSFLVRRRYAKRFHEDLKRLLGTGKYESVDLIGHSFGTYLIAYALKRLEACGQSKIRNVILCGSVLKESFDWSDIVGSKVVRVVNDCGYCDKVLLINKCLIPFGGMAGRVGFQGLDSEVINRYFNGGHDVFYLRNKVVDSYFIKKYWIPILAGNANIIKYDGRNAPGKLEDFIILIHVISVCKDGVCIILPIIILGYVFILLW